eukprot:6574059-Prorocentrum_lima.AAC.1
MTGRRVDVGDARSGCRRFSQKATWCGSPLLCCWFMGAVAILVPQTSHSSLLPEKSPLVYKWLASPTCWWPPGAVHG